MNNILFNLAIEPFGTEIGEYYNTEEQPNHTCFVSF